MLKLNLGGGEKAMPGWETVDLYSTNPRYKVDLSVFPWPFADKSVDAVAMFHFLEHLENVERTVQEVHRILKPGGEFWVIVPHAKNPTAWDISHRHCFSCVTFATIAGKSYYRFGGKQLFKTIFFRMPLIQHRWIKWTPLDLIAARFPVFFEKFIPFAPAHIEWKGMAL
ncbi:MAG TPA: methyltransferase domain-containing protein [Verrucomicrobiae bacterium]